MAIKEDIKRERAERDAPAAPGDGPRPAVSSEGMVDPGDAEAEADASASAVGALREETAPALDDVDPTYDVAPVGSGGSPAQLGTKRFVYAAYFAGAIAIAFLMSKAIDVAWFRLQSYKPAVGEPRDEIVMPLSGAVGALAAVYFWYRTRARQLAEEVANEMAKVTWPSRTEVTNGTFVVIVTTIVSTVFFALMDRFWGFITNLVYGGS